MSLIEVKLRPTSPWRVGERAGDRERVDVVYHSDSLYSAVTHAMHSLGWLDEWLDATARAAGEPAVRFSSLFPFVGKTRLVSPPKTLWPPGNIGKLYLQGAKLIPLDVVRGGVVEESRWQVDGESECLVPMGGSAPFRVSLRAAAAVDRVTGATEAHRTACLEFGSNAGWWGVFEASTPDWEARVKSALRLLADSGFGGERSRGWGRAAEPAFSDASHLFGRSQSSGNPASGNPGSGNKDGMWWLLSLYSPHESDGVDWSHGEYSAQVRGGWTDSVAGAGPKKQVRMITEGSVLSAGALRGQVVDVAPDGFPHPVYRSGFALAVPAPAEIVVRMAEASRPARVVPEPAAESVESPVAEAAVAPEDKPASVGGSAEPEAEPVATPIESPIAEEVVSPDDDPASVGGSAEPEAEPVATPVESPIAEEVVSPEDDPASVRPASEAPAAEPVDTDRDEASE
jgi:CRISPR type III-A-associated RAMP protein Csm4